MEFKLLSVSGLQDYEKILEKNIMPDKKPIKKHQPKGLEIIYEDLDIIVVNKASGLLTVSTDREKEKTAFFLLNDYVRKGNAKSRNRVFIVHRLDRDTSGILVFAKNEKAKNYLQDNWSDFSKIYHAVVLGKLKEKEGIIETYLTENSAFRVYSTNDTVKGKLAKTGFKVLKESENFSLLEITLFTGRKHQIRVHFSEKGHPVAGDKIYGISDKGTNKIALHSASLTISHPFSKEKMTFETETPEYFKTFFRK